MSADGKAEDIVQDRSEASRDPIVSEDLKDGEIVEEHGETREEDEERIAGEEENVMVSDLKPHEKKALIDLKMRVEEAILTNNLFVVETDKKKQESEENERTAEQDGNQENPIAQEKIDKGMTLWGIPLLPSQGDDRTDVLLCKFLRARDYKPQEAFEMLKKTLVWRKDNKMDAIMEEDLGEDYNSVGYMKGLDQKGHPVCYNVYGVLSNEDMYNKILGTEESRERFLRWRLQLLERGIQKLDFAPAGVSTMLQVNDLKNTPGPSRKDLRLAVSRAVEILQDNYPEFVSRNIFINAPFWCYAFNAILSPFLTQRTKSKFIFCRPSRATETLLKHIAANEIPVCYGGLQKDNDTDFSTDDSPTEVIVRGGARQTIEIPLPEAGSTLTWDLTIVGWDVFYEEEFVPTDEGSYTLVVKKGRNISWQDVPIRNSFLNREPGKLVITVQNGRFKKKRVLYRYKIKDPHLEPSLGDADRRNYIEQHVK